MACIPHTAEVEQELAGGGVVGGCGGGGVDGGGEGGGLYPQGEVGEVTESSGRSGGGGKRKEVRDGGAIRK